MSKDDSGEEGYVLLKYRSKEQKKMLKDLLEEGFELIKKMNEYEDKPKRKKKKETRFSEWKDEDGNSMKKYDEKNQEKPGMPHPKSEKGAP